MLLEIISDAFLDTVKMVPLLLVIYIGIELLEYKFGDKIRNGIQSAGSAGPALGSLIGSFPQCGFSVIATALYTQRMVTIGTLLAVYLSTSDEAIPILLSNPEKSGIVIPLIFTKILIAFIAGYAIDFLFRKKNKKVLQHIKNYSQGNDDFEHHHESVADEVACCGHCADCQSQKFNFKEIFWHPIIHTAKIFIFLFAASILIGLILNGSAGLAIANFLSTHKFFQPFFAALIGLIPNCAASVAITEFYLQGLLSYGSAIAGLSASGGLGILVLIKEEKDKKNIWFIISLLLAISIASGLIIEYIF